MSYFSNGLTATRWNIVASFVRTSVGLVLVAILARLLSPGDFALMALASVMVGFVSVFSEMGFNISYIQRQFISDAERSSLYWFSLLLGLFFTIITALSGKYIEEFFQQKDLAELISIISLNFIILSIGQQYKISLEKKMEFKPVAIVEICSAILSLISGVIAAFFGLGVYAFAIASVTLSIFSSASYCLFLSRGWRPHWIFRQEDIRWHIRFGSTSVLGNIITYFNSNLDIFIGGKLIESTQFGFFTVPRNLTLQVQNIINPVFTRIGFPLMARNQNDMEVLKNTYIDMLNLSVSTNAPIFVFVYFYSSEIIELVLGNGWLASVTLLKLLSVWALLRSIVNPVGSLLNAIGKVGLALKWNVMVLFVGIPFLYLGSLGGNSGVTVSLILLILSLIVPGWYFLLYHTCGISLAKYTSTVLRPIFASITCGLTSVYLTSEIDGNLLRLIFSIILFVFAYYLLSKQINYKMVKFFENVFISSKDDRAN